MFTSLSPNTDTLTHGEDFKEGTAIKTSMRARHLLDPDTVIPFTKANHTFN